MLFHIFQYINILLIASLHCYSQNSQFNEFNECEKRIHRECSQSMSFTEEEVENARIYLQKRFYKTNPVKPACNRLHVRKNIKCLSKRELSEFIDAVQQMYKNGVMDTFSLIHATYWPSIHKFAEAIIWHRWHVNQMEKELRKVNSRVTMPYWESYSEFAAPEKSIIWNFMGRAGNLYNNYCVSDGSFANQKVLFPRPHCLKRQWNPNGTIPTYESPEWMTSVIQRSTNFVQFLNLFGFTGHFKLHLAIGGYNGDYSIPFATNDPLFYVFHEYPASVVTLKWQLSEDQNLVPQTYNEGFRFDWKTQQSYAADIENDFLTFYEDIRVKETFQIGFGELCYIHDFFIKPINDIIRNERQQFPIAVNRLRYSLPSKLYYYYYPKFASKTATFFDHLLPDVGKCPLNNECSVMPTAEPYNATLNGKRQLEAFRSDAFVDQTPDLFAAENMYYRFMNHLKDNNYCSPYV